MFKKLSSLIGGYATSKAGFNPEQFTGKEWMEQWISTHLKYVLVLSVVVAFTIYKCGGV